MAAAVVPLLELHSHDFLTQFLILSLGVLLIASLLLYGSLESLADNDDLRLLEDKEDELRDLLEDQQGIDLIIPHYRVEYALALIAFCFTGGQVIMVAYISTYLEQTKLITTPYKSCVFLTYWVCLTLGSILGAYHRRSLDDNALLSTLTVCCVLGSSSLFVLYIFPQSMVVLWVTIAMYAFSSGAHAEYRYVLYNRFTLPTESSFTIVMIGEGCGASLVPYLTIYAWELNYNRPSTFIIALLMCTALPLPLILLVTSLSYRRILIDFELLHTKTLFHCDDMTDHEGSFRGANGKIVLRSLLKLLDTFNTIPGNHANTINYGSISWEDIIGDNGL
jgi:fucose permease